MGEIIQGVFSEFCREKILRNIKSVLYCINTLIELSQYQQGSDLAANAPRIFFFFFFFFGGGGGGGCKLFEFRSIHGPVNESTVMLIILLVVNLFGLTYDKPAIA